MCVCVCVYKYSFLIIYKVACKRMYVDASGLVWRFIQSCMFYLITVLCDRPNSCAEALLNVIPSAKILLNLQKHPSDSSALQLVDSP